MGGTVLICDDAAFMRSCIARVLTGAGFEVVAEATNAKEAVERYVQYRPDLVTMDIVMPDRSGVEALRDILAEDPEARVLMCTAINQKPLVDDALKIGAKHYVVKPFTPPDLLNAVEVVFSCAAKSG